MKNTKQLVLAAFFLALGIILPFFTAQIGAIGSKLLPMHFPVLIAGFVCGGPLGFLVGFITPILRSVMFGMPPMFPTALAMAFELGGYGLLTGLLYQKMKKTPLNTYIILITSMIGGRVIWGLVSVILYSMANNPFAFEMFISGAFLNAIPGIILQIIIVPIIILALEKQRLI